MTIEGGQKNALLRRANIKKNKKNKGVILTHPPKVDKKRELASEYSIKSCSPSKVAKEWCNLPFKNLLNATFLTCSL